MRTISEFIDFVVWIIAFAVWFAISVAILVGTVALVKFIWQALPF